MMKCYICNSEAKETRGRPYGRDSWHISCPGCGKYQIAQSVIHQAREREFDVTAMRKHLISERENLETTSPIIRSGLI